MEMWRQKEMHHKFPYWWPYGSLPVICVHRHAHFIAYRGEALVAKGRAVIAQGAVRQHGELR